MYYIAIVIYFISILTYYVSLIIYNIDIVIDYNKRYILIIILIIYYITKTEHLYPLKYSLGTALSPSFSSVYSYFMSCPVILVAVIKVGDITVAFIWVGSEVWSFWSRSLRSRSFRSWSFLSVF